MKKIIKNAINVILSLWAIIGLDFIVQQGEPFIKMFPGNNNAKVILYDSMVLSGNFSGNTVILILAFCFLFMLIKKALNIKQSRMIICSLIPAILFSAFVIIGNCINYTLSISIIFDYFLIFMIKFIGLLITFYSVIIVLFDKLSNSAINIKSYESKFFTNNKKSFLIIALIIFVSYLPYFLKEFPWNTSV